MRCKYEQWHQNLSIYHSKCPKSPRFVWSNIAPKTDHFETLTLTKLQKHENLKNFLKAILHGTKFLFFLSTSVFLLILHLILIVSKSTLSGNISDLYALSPANDVFHFFSLLFLHLKSAKKNTFFDGFHKILKISIFLEDFDTNPLLSKDYYFGFYEFLVEFPEIWRF